MVESYETTTLRMGPAGQPPCALVQDLLPLYLEGEVSPSSQELIVEHLGSCERCAGFLAGAQSVRGQLSRERRARETVAAVAQPERRTVLGLRALLAGAAALIICMIGGGASVMVGMGGEESLVGMLIGSGALFALLLLARVLGPLTRQRLTQLGTSVVTGMLAGIVIGGGGNEGVLVAAVLLALTATPMVCSQIARAAAAPAR